jgi:hypothetical protein
MKIRIALLSACLVLIPALRGAVAPDATLTGALNTFVSNGLEAGLRQLYSDRAGLAVEMRDEMAALTKNLGDIIDTEFVAAQPVSKRVTRFYIAIYYTRRPVWVRVERYENRDRSFYLPLKFSLSSDDILPGYITEFRQ